MRLRHLTTMFAIALVAAGCSASMPSQSPSAAPTSAPTTSTPVPSSEPSPSPSLSPDPSGLSYQLRTFPWSREHDGVLVGCDTIGVVDPVYGHLAGSLAADGLDVVWLDAPDGRHLSILWPEGFKALFAPSLTIYDETGGLVAREGDSVMAQVNRHDAAGSYDDPYYLSGILLAGTFTPGDLSTGIAFQGCYPAVPNVGPAPWWVKPETLPIPASARTIDGFIVEESCASGRSPEGRVVEPTIEYRADAIFITFTVTKRPSPQDCPGNPEYPVEIRLAEPVGARALLDGSVAPPRDATHQP